MAKIQKKLEKWLENTPTEVPVNEVEAVLTRFFPGQYERKAGSHIVVRDPRLKGLPDYGPSGDFTIPVKRGQKVKGYYLKDLVKTIKFLKELEESQP